MADSLSMPREPSDRTPVPPAFGLFNLGFRPFYLLAAILAAASLPVWVAQFFGVLPASGYISGIAWHAHEMVFGFAVAVIAGFLFTAVLNWTGLPTPTGRTLAALAALWLSGRILLLTGPAVAAAAVDIAFLPAVAWYLWRPLSRARNRNRFFVGLLLGLAALNAAFHLALAGVIRVSSVAVAEAGIGMVLVVVAIMAGRVVPSFTRNAIRTARIRSLRGLDGAAIASLVLAWTAWLAGVPAAVAAPLALAAAALHAVRLWTWDPWCTRGQPILWILHASYAWIPIGLLLLALSIAGIAGTPALAVHGLAAGAIGGMVMGMITRTARGHTGMPLRVGPIEVAAYALVHLGAVARVFVPLAVPEWYAGAMVVAAACWSVAFALYVLVYWPLLSRARVDGKPG